MCLQKNAPPCTPYSEFAKWQLNADSIERAWSFALLFDTFSFYIYPKYDMSSEAK